jgi:hypothetical protein
MPNLYVVNHRSLRLSRDVCVRVLCPLSQFILYDIYGLLNKAVYFPIFIKNIEHICIRVRIILYIYM